MLTAFITVFVSMVILSLIVLYSIHRQYSGNHFPDYDDDRDEVDRQIDHSEEIKDII